jgi:TATA-binding protein-associated factor Taf7
MQGTAADESWPAEAEFPASALPDDDSNVAQDVPEPEEVDPRAEPILKRIADLKASIADVETKATTQTLKPLKLRFEATLGTLRQELKAAEQELENLNT